VARPTKTSDTELGAQLRRLRKAKGFTQTELGEAIGTSHRMIVYYEIQGGNPPADVVIKLARALDVSADELLGLGRPGKEKREAPANLRLMRKLRRVQELPPGDRQSVLRFIDALLEKESLKKART
jgi:transcriptional regulator with XRE-family HTH domain